MQTVIFGAKGYLGDCLSKYFRSKDQAVVEISRENIDSSHNTIRHDKCIFVVAAGPTAKSASSDFDKEQKFARHFNEKIRALIFEFAPVKIIILSSVHVYSKSLNGEFNEYSPTTNDHPYALASKNKELFFLKLRETYGLPVIILRLSNIFGLFSKPVGDAMNLVGNQFLADGILKKEIKILGNPEQVISPVPILHMLWIFDYLIASADHNYRKIYPIQVVASEESMTLHDFALRIKNTISQCCQLGNISIRFGRRQVVPSNIFILRNINNPSFICDPHRWQIFLRKQVELARINLNDRIYDHNSDI